MNLKFRLIALILVLAMCCSMLSSCFLATSIGKAMLEASSKEDSSKDASNGQVVITPQDQEGSFKILEYTYDLTQEDINALISLLEQCEQTVKESADRETVLDRIAQAEDAFYDMQTQEQLAYIAYCIDGENELYKGAYDFSSEASQDVYLKYMEMCQRIYDGSNYVSRDVFFEDWTEADVAMMLAYSGEVAQLGKENDDILLDYRALDENGFESETGRLFLDMVENNNRIAEIFGYDSYMDYAYELVYERDYTPAEAAQMRAYIKKHLVPLCKTAVEKFVELRNKLTVNNVIQMERFLLRDADIANVESFHQYINSYPVDLSFQMNTLFDGEHAIIIPSGNEDAYEGAFTAYLDGYDTPICYFGSGYQSVFTYAHEMGHFVSAYYSTEDSVPLDVAELQSQGNEVMYLAYLMEQNPNSTYYKAVTCYSLYRFLADIISTAVIDEFESAVYRNPSLTVDELDNLMEGIVESYGGAEWYGEYIGDAVSYWKYVVIESPVYYISYSVSAIAALELFSVALSNYEAGQQAYMSAVTDAPTLGTFKTVVQEMGVSSPFEETAYEGIKVLLNDF